MTLVSRTSVSAMRPTVTTIPTDVDITACPLLCVRARRGGAPAGLPPVRRHVGPRPDVRESVLKARDHDFRALGDRASVFAAGARHAADAGLLEQNLARPARPDRAAHGREQADEL